MSSVIELYPAAAEVAVFSFPADTTVRVHHPACARDYRSMYAGDPEFAGRPFAATIPGGRELLGWGAPIVHYYDVRRIALGHRKLDRPAWQAAAKAIRGGGAVYVQHHQQDYYGKPRWAATGVREAPVPGYPRWVHYVSGVQLTFCGEPHDELPLTSNWAKTTCPNCKQERLEARRDPGGPSAR